MILGMLFLSKFKTIIDLGKQLIYLLKLGTNLTINHFSTLFSSSARIKLLQEDIKLILPKDFQITLDKLATNKALLNLIAAYIQVPIKVLTFNPITEFPDIFPEFVPNKLPPLRELHMHH